jgi:hypothetical protein
VVPQARISRRRNATVQRVTKTMRVQLAISKAVMPERPVRGADVSYPRQSGTNQISTHL